MTAPKRSGRHMPTTKPREAPGKRSRTSRSGHRKELGDWGENQVARWYEQQGYTVADRQWRTRHGELDLVLVLDRTIVFCEVKTRSSMRYGHPAEAVTAAKQRRIRGLAIEWLRSNRARQTELRFDVAAVIGDEIDVRQAAF